MMPSRHSIRSVALLALLAATLPAAALAQRQDATAHRRVPWHIPLLYPDDAAPVGAAVAPTDTPGLRFRAGLVRPAAPGGRGVMDPGRLLTMDEAARVFAWLRPIGTGEAAADSFFFPAPTLPPPRAGRTLAALVPPRAAARPVARPAVALSALEVIRRAPEGETDGPAELSVTFSHPMVPLSSIATVAAHEVPVHLTPQPVGSWRWIDTRTIRFEADGGLPKATTFTVEIPAGTRAADGAALERGERWTFATPPPMATGAWPQGGSIGFTPVLLLAFDQRIDPAAVLRSLRASVSERAVSLRLATPAELAADTQAAKLARQQTAGRWMALRLVDPLAPNAQVRVAVGPGTPSAEGSRVTEDEQFWRFSAHGAFTMEGVVCGCRARQPIAIRLSNPADERGFRPEMVRVEPAIEGMQAWVAGDMLVITGETRPRTRYTVTASPRMRDVFGQAMGSRPVIAHVGLPWAAVGAPRDMVVLDPRGGRSITVMTLAHARLRLRLMRVRPHDWFAFLGLPLTRARPALLPGAVALEREVTIANGLDGDPHPLEVDLSPALADGAGQVLVAVEAMDGGDTEERVQAAYVWVQATRIGVTAFNDGTALTAWATSLADGAPLAGARVEMITRSTPRGDGVPRPGPAATDARGVAALPLAGGPELGERLLAVRLGNDLAILSPEMTGRYGYAAWLPAGPRAVLWHAFTDRMLYRPGETVRFKGWVRPAATGPDGGLALPAAGDSVAWTAFDPLDNEIARGTAPLAGPGGFDAAFTVPAGASLGDARIELRLVRAAGRAATPAHGSGRASSAGGVDADGEDEEETVEYRVDEFRRPEYTVTATAGDGPFFVGGAATITARAAYLAGGGLPGAPAQWEVNAYPGYFSPPGWNEWTFGGAGDGDESFDRAHDHALSGVTDADGQTAVRIDFSRAEPPVPYTVHAQATVTDVNRQTWTATTDLLVHPASIYVGLRTRRAWLQRGDTISLEVVTVDLDGRPVAGRTVEVSAVARTWRPVEGRWMEVTVDSVARVCTRVTTAQPVRCPVRAARAGMYQLRATARDARGRPAVSVARSWVAGPGAFMSPPGPGNEAEAARLTADKPEYAVGDTARVLLRTRFFPARGLVTVHQGGIARTRAVRVAASTTTLAIPITAADIPNVWVGVELVGAGVRDSVRGVAHASARTSLRVSAASRALTVTALPRDSVAAPDASTAVGVMVRDAAGRPVPGAEVALVVVDEAVLALAGYRIGNPLASFHPTRDNPVGVARLRSLVQRALPDFAPAPRTVVGRVSSALTGGGLAGATVSLQGTQRSALTDPAGRFRIAGVAPGRYTVVARMDAFGEARVPVTVAERPVPVVRLALIPDAVRIRGMSAYASTVMSREMGVHLEGVVVTASGVQEALAGKVAGVEVAGAEVAGAAPIALRARFDALALFTPAVRTDADGRATVPFTLPSNLTRYRVTAVAVHDSTLYGIGESTITARQPLMVRPSAPRFLNWGDRFELPVVVQNLGAAPVEADVAVRGDGVEMLEPGRHVTVPARDRVEVRLLAHATRAGPATLQVAAVGPGGSSDAAQVTLPVYTPATTEAFATHGTFTGDSAVAIPLAVPADAIPSFGGMEVSASSTALQELSDALLYLVSYPYECSEQIASRILGVTALRDVAAAFGTRELPPPEVLNASVQRDILTLVARQDDQGAVGFWERGHFDFPYVSIHAAHALQRAREKGYEVPDGAMANALGYLRAVPGNLPSWYRLDVRHALTAYALYVRARMADRTAADDVRDFVEDTPRDSVSAEMAGWLLSAATADTSLAEVRAELLRVINNRASETASTATFATRYTDGEYLLMHSDRRTDGVVLEALLAAQPRNPLVPKVVRGLLGHRTRGRWDNTQENGWVLVALDRYFRAFEAETPEFVARVWLGDRFAGEHAFHGRQTDRWQVSVPMRALQGQAPDAVTVAKEGQGRVYYRAALRYAPRRLDLPPLDAGFTVSRRYDAVDDAADVRHAADGSWHVRAGARVRVTLTMTAPARRLYVALVDPLAAGLEPVNPELQGTRDVPPAAADTAGWQDGAWWWRRYWYQHQNLRDDRAEAFTSLLRAGTYTWSYVARATTPGTFVAPPPRAEEMYSPETFGRGASDRVVVEAADGR